VDCIVPNCFVTIIVDGALQYAPVDTLLKPPDITRFSLNDLSGVEYYPDAGTGPPQFNLTGSICGTLLLWTRGSPCRCRLPPHNFG
jgi:hypothetical protein